MATSPEERAGNNIVKKKKPLSRQKSLTCGSHLSQPLDHLRRTRSLRHGGEKYNRVNKNNLLLKLKGHELRVKVISI